MRWTRFVFMCRFEGWNCLYWG